ncbi:MAG: DHH family phosphoesterase [Oscillospiraceae bacterium]|nr:DHH family phosphoesterase [Oscillospiraceae bacterium]
MNKKLGRLLQPSMGMYFAFMAGFAIVAFVMQYYILFGVELVLTMGLFAFYVMQKRRRQKDIQTFIDSTINDLDSAGKAESPFPKVMIRLADGVIIWTNDAFDELSGFKEHINEQKITDLLPNFTAEWLAAGKSEYPYDVTLGGRRYRVYGSTLRANDPNSTFLGMLYLTDLTELYQVRDEYIRSRPVVSIILIDNYEELTKNLTDSAISTLNAQINDVITNWTDRYQGLLRKLERNRYLFFFEKRDLSHAAEEKFSLLEEIHQVTNPSGLSASISFGLGVDGVDFRECYDFAALAIEMSLSRGGDQAVVKDRFNFNFYGGRTNEADHRSKVRSRVTANSLMELIGQSSQVFIMGHKNADLDAVGAAMGISCMCRKKGKKALIVLDLENNASEKLLEEIRAVPEYKDVFISGQEALLRCDNHSTLIVVDTNRPDQVECKSLLEAIPKVCVVDHHRRAADYINPVVVNLHEPYASSAAELVTELLQYAVEKADVYPIEAKSLLAGLFLDTKSFNVRTGQRTFEAAAYLRQLGADPVEVKKLLQNDFQDTIAKYQIIKSARLYRQEIAIAALNSGTSRTLAAQAADELLNISGITASFVLYPEGGRVIISARSIGKTNVQMILEPLGGGGNAATAGAQVKDSTVKDTLDRLVASIDQFFEE